MTKAKRKVSKRMQAVQREISEKVRRRFQATIKHERQQLEDLKAQLERYEAPLAIKDYTAANQSPEGVLADIAKMIRIALGDGINAAAGVRRLITERGLNPERVFLQAQLNEARAAADVWRQKFTDLQDVYNKLVPMPAVPKDSANLFGMRD